MYCGCESSMASALPHDAKGWLQCVIVVLPGHVHFLFLNTTSLEFEITLNGVKSHKQHFILTQNSNTYFI